MTDSALKELISSSLTLAGALPHLDLLHYLLTEAGGKHTAHCLDLDLATVGKSQKDAASKLDDLVKAHIELALATGQLTNLSTRAPQAYWKQFAEGKRIVLKPTTLHIQIPESVQVVPVPESELQILAHAA